MSKSTPAGEVITLPEAIVYVNDFRSKFPEEIKASIFDTQFILELLNQPNCAQLKMYYGYDSVKGNLSPVLVGVDSNGNDLTEGIILDRAAMCPPNCDVNSPLMK